MDNGMQQQQNPRPTWPQQHPGSWYSPGQFQFQGQQQQHQQQQQQQQWIPPPHHMEQYGYAQPQMQHQPQPQPQTNLPYSSHFQPQRPPLPPLPPPPHQSQVTQMYAQPDQVWSNPHWSNQNREYEGKSSAAEQDWAAKAREWAAAKAAMEAQQTPLEYTTVNKPVDQHNIYSGDFSQPVQPRYPEVQHSGPHTIPQPPNIRATQFEDPTDNFSSTMPSSNTANGYVLYNLKDGIPENSLNSTTYSSQNPVSTVPSSYPQEASASYSSNSGVEDQRFSFSMTMGQDNHVSKGQYPLQSAQAQLQTATQTHQSFSDQQTGIPDSQYAYSDQQATVPQSYPFSDPQVAPVSDYNEKMNTSSTWPQLSGRSSSFPANSSVVPPTNQFEHPYISAPHASHPTQFPGRLPGPVVSSAFRPGMPSVAAPFAVGPGNPGVPSGPAVMVPPAYMGETNPGFGVPERPKKASVPNWIKEELLKKQKASAIPNALAHDQNHEDSYHVNEIGNEDQPLPKDELMDNRSADSARESDDEEDEDFAEKQREAAINKEIKRVLTEVLTKVTNELFDEIAQEVLDEGESTFQAKMVSTASIVTTQNSAKTSSPTQTVSKATTSGKVVVSVKNSSNNADVNGENSTSSAAVGDLLGLGNYNTDDDDDVTEETKEVVPGTSKLQEGILDGAELLEESSSVKTNDKMVDRDIKGAVECDLATSNRKGITSNDATSGLDNNSDNASKSQASVVCNDLDKAKDGFENNDLDVDHESKNHLTDMEPKNQTLLNSDSRIVNSNHLDRKSKNTGGKQSVSVDHSRDKGKSREREREKDKRRERDWDNQKARDVKEMEKDWEKENDKDKSRDDRKRSDRGNHGGRRGVDSMSEKENRKDYERAKKSTGNTDYGKKYETEKHSMQQRRKERGTSNSDKGRKRSPSISGRGRNSRKVDSLDTNKSSSSTEAVENAKRRARASRRSLSPSPTRSKKRRVSRSRSRSHSRTSHLRHTDRRHSPYHSSGSRNKRSRSRSRSRSPVRRRR